MTNSVNLLVFFVNFKILNILEQRPVSLSWESE